MSNFWDFMWLIASAFLFVGYLLILFRIIADLFNDSDLGGGSKALWLICLLFLGRKHVDDHFTQVCKHD